MSSKKEKNKIYLPTTLGKYMENILNVPLLTDREAKNLMLELQIRKKLELSPESTRSPEVNKQINASKNLEIKLLEANQMLVLLFAQQNKKTGLELLDLIKAGNKGLERSIYKFNPFKDYSFALYSQWWIMQGISLEIRNFIGNKQNKKMLPQFKFEDNQFEQFDLREYETTNFIFKRGLVFSSLEMYKQANKDFAKGLEQEPENIKFLSTIADYKYELGNYDEAIRYLDKGIKLDPIVTDKASLFLDRARVHFELKNKEQANKDFAKVLELEPENIKFLSTIADYKYESGNYDVAIRYYDKAVVLDKNNAALRCKGTFKSGSVVAIVVIFEKQSNLNLLIQYIG